MRIRRKCMEPFSKSSKLARPFGQSQRQEIEERSGQVGQHAEQDLQFDFRSLGRFAQTQQDRTLRQLKAAAECQPGDLHQAGQLMHQAEALQKRTEVIEP